jgi:hypothetical protein
MSNHHLSPPVDHRQVDIAIPGMAGNAVRLQNIHSYYPIVGSNNSAQSSVTIPMTLSDTLWSSNAYPSTNTYYYPTQASTDFGAAGNPAMESDFQLSYSPPMYVLSTNIRVIALLTGLINSQSPHSHTPPHGSRSQWQNPANSYRLPSNSDLRTELGQPLSHLASESQRGTSYRGRSSSSYLPVPPSLSHTSQSQWQNGANHCPLLVNPDLRTELDQPSLHPASDSESQRGISHGGRPSYPLVPTSHTSHYSRSQWKNPTNSCSLSANPDLRTMPDPSESQRGMSYGGRSSYPPVPISHTSHYSQSQWQNPANSYPLPANSDLRTEPDQLSPHLASESQGGISHRGRPSYQPVPSTHTPPHSSRSQWQNKANSDVRTPPGQPWSPSAFGSQPGISLGDHPSCQPIPTQPNQDLFRGEGPRQSSPHRHASLSCSRAQEGLLSCHWLNEDNILCGYKGSQDALKAHMSIHLSGPQDAQIGCRWKGCDYARRGQPGVHTMRRDSAWRHVLEIHLHIKFRKKL